MEKSVFMVTAFMERIEDDHKRNLAYSPQLTFNPLTIELSTISVLAQGLKGTPEATAHVSTAQRAMERKENIDLGLSNPSTLSTRFNQLLQAMK